MGNALVDYSGTKSYENNAEIIGKGDKKFSLVPVFDKGLTTFLGYNAMRISGKGEPVSEGREHFRPDGTVSQPAFFVSESKVDYFIKNSNIFYDISKKYSTSYITWDQMEESPLGAILDPRFMLAANLEGVILKQLTRSLASNIIRKQQKKVLEELLVKVASKQMTRKEFKDITTVVTGINIETGQTATALNRTSQNRGALCAEDLVVNQLGGDTKKK